MDEWKHGRQRRHDWHRTIDRVMNTLSAAAMFGVFGYVFVVSLWAGLTEPRALPAAAFFGCAFVMTSVISYRYFADARRSDE